MGTWVKPVRELNGQEQSQVESYRRLNKTPLEICQVLDWDPDVYLGVVRRHCESMPRRYRVGVVERLSAAMTVDRGPVHDAAEGGDVRRKNPVTMKPLTRACTRCGARPPMAQFSTRTVAGKSYRHSWCLDCQRALNREYKSRQRDLETNGLGVPFGSHHPRAKLTEADVLLIWGLIASGLSDYAIAPKFEVSPATIWTIRAGKSWKHCHPRYAAEGAGHAGQ